MSFTETASYMKAPAGASATQCIAGTGSTAAGHTTALTSGRMATLMNGANAIVVLWASSNTGNPAVTDVPVGPYGRLDWFVEAGTAFVRVEAYDQASTFTCTVWTSSQ